MVLRPGDPWGGPPTGAADAELEGDDGALAALAARMPGARVRFRPTPGSDLARALGIRPGIARGDGDGGPARELPVDGLRVRSGGREGLALNAVVLGTAPGRLRRRSRSREVEVMLDGRPWLTASVTTLVVANGEFLDGLDARLVVALLG